jgi:hypothetical protein
VWNSQVAGGVTRKCVAGTDTLESASEVGLNEDEDRAGESETGMKSGYRRMRRSIMSKAALRSKLMRVKGLPSSQDRKMLSKVINRAVSVDSCC